MGKKSESEQQPKSEDSSPARPESSELVEQPFDSAPSTLAHIQKVQSLFFEIFKRLLDRAQNHDASKLIEPEKELFDKATPKLAGLEYGSEEYQAALDELKPALEHHYAKNSHHPEHYPDGVDGMTLMDLVEMFCDWKASSDRQHDGNLRKSLECNKKRFGLSKQLFSILENTMKEMGW